MVHLPVLWRPESIQNNPISVGYHLKALLEGPIPPFSTQNFLEVYVA